MEIIKDCCRYLLLFKSERCSSVTDVDSIGAGHGDRLQVVSFPTDSSSLYINVYSINYWVFYPRYTVYGVEKHII